MSYRSARSLQPFKVLLVSSFHPKATDLMIRETLHRQFRKFGDTSVRILLEPDGRVAFVYFRNHDEASEAFNSKVNLIFYEKAANIKPVIECHTEDTDVVSRPTSYTSSSSPSRSFYRTHHSSYSHTSTTSYCNRSPVYSEPQYHKNYRLQSYSPYQPRSSHGSSYDYYARDYHYTSSAVPRGRPRGSWNGGRISSSYRGRAPWSRIYDSNRNEIYSSGQPQKYFPYQSYYVPPEEDVLATRTLFVGNLELNTTEEELRKKFESYGRLMEVSVKRPPTNTGNAFAFIRYENVDMAYLAKKELSGHFLGRFPFKIGFGKSLPSNRVWIGGLGSWFRASMIWKEFDRFGVVDSLEYEVGQNFAIIIFATVEAAEAAVQAMRGFPLGGSDRRIRVDFGTDEEVKIDTISGLQNQAIIGERQDNPLEGIQTLNGICKKAPMVWEGDIILKKSCFSIQLHLIDGSPKIVDYLKNKEGENCFVISQRLKMDQSKLDEVTVRLNDVQFPHSVFVGVSAASADPTPPFKLQLTNDFHQAQPFRNLISYLKAKDSAGVIAMTFKDSKLNFYQKILYCFPPCDFSRDMLQHNAPDLKIEVRDDFVVVVVVVAATASLGGNVTTASLNDKIASASIYDKVASEPITYKNSNASAYEDNNNSEYKTVA